MPSITNEGLAIKIENLSVQFTKLEAALHANAATYVSHDVFELRIKEIDSQIASTNAKILELQTSLDKNSRSRWVQNTLSAILGAVLSILIAYFFTNIGK